VSESEKRTEYSRRATEARQAAAGSSCDILKMVLYSIARLWERLGQRAKSLVAIVPAAAACGVWMGECCMLMHGHCPCCIFGL
jgi:hypothetical protein